MMLISKAVVIKNRWNASLVDELLDLNVSVADG